MFIRILQDSQMVAYFYDDIVFKFKVLFFLSISYNSLSWKSQQKVKGLRAQKLLNMKKKCTPFTENKDEIEKFPPGTVNVVQFSNPSLEVVVQERP